MRLDEVMQWQSEVLSSGVMVRSSALIQGADLF